MQQFQTRMLVMLLIIHTTNSAHNLHFYQLKPYLYKEDNAWKGIMVDFFEAVNQMDSDCPFQSLTEDVKKPTNSVATITSIFNFTKEYTNRTEFLSQNRQYFDERGHLNETTIWFPSLGMDLVTHIPYSDYDVVSEDILVPVVLRESLDVIGKTYMISTKMRVPLVMGIVLVVVTALILRLVDWRSNPQYDKHFFMKGFGTSLWMAAVSLFGVGYGDVTPKSALAKTLGSFFLLAGLIYSATFVAVSIDIFGSNDVLHTHKTAAVLKDSFEELLVRRDFSGLKVHAYESYEQMLEAVRTKETEVAVFPMDVAGYLQDTWNNGQEWQQRVTVPSLVEGVSVPAKMMVYGPARWDFNVDCDIHYTLKVQAYAIHKYRKKIKLFKNMREDLVTLLTEKTYYRAIYIIIAVLVTLGLLYDMFCWYKNKMRPRTPELQVINVIEKTRRIEVDKEDWISLQIEVRLIGELVQEIVKSQQPVEAEEGAEVEEQIETQTMPALSRMGSRNVSFRESGLIKRTGSFPETSPRRPVVVKRNTTSYESYPRVTNQVRATNRAKSWKIPNRAHRPANVARVKRYETFHRVPNGTNTKTYTTTRQRQPNMVVKRGQTFMVPNGHAVDKKKMAKLKRGESFPARYHQAVPQHLSEFTANGTLSSKYGHYNGTAPRQRQAINMVNQSINGTVPRISYPANFKQRPSLDALAFGHLQNGDGGYEQIGDISIDYANVNPVFEAEHQGEMVITEC